MKIGKFVVITIMLLLLVAFGTMNVSASVEFSNKKIGDLCYPLIQILKTPDAEQTAQEVAVSAYMWENPAKCLEIRNNFYTRLLNSMDQLDLSKDEQEAIRKKVKETLPASDASLATTALCYTNSADKKLSAKLPKSLGELYAFEKVVNELNNDEEDGEESGKSTLSPSEEKEGRRLGDAMQLRLLGDAWARFDPELSKKFYDESWELTKTLEPLDYFGVASMLACSAYQYPEIANQVVAKGEELLNKSKEDDAEIKASRQKMVKATKFCLKLLTLGAGKIRYAGDVSQLVNNPESCWPVFAKDPAKTQEVKDFIPEIRKKAECKDYDELSLVLPSVGLLASYSMDEAGEIALTAFQNALELKDEDLQRLVVLAAFNYNLEAREIIINEWMSANNSTQENYKLIVDISRKNRQFSDTLVASIEELFPDKAELLPLEAALFYNALAHVAKDSAKYYKLSDAALEELAKEEDTPEDYWTALGSLICEEGGFDNKRCLDYIKRLANALKDEDDALKSADASEQILQTWQIRLEHAPEGIYCSVK